MPDKDDLLGKAKEAVGKATDDKDLEREGKTDQVAGKAKDKIDDLADKARDVIDT